MDKLPFRIACMGSGRASERKMGEEEWAIPRAYLLKK